jgi:tetratricopeptide (TPR) repeat protein
VLGPEHPDTALSLNNLAALYHATGAYAKAEPLFERALAIREKAPGRQHPDTALSLHRAVLVCLRALPGQRDRSGSPESVSKMPLKPR